MDYVFIVMQECNAGFRPYGRHTDTSNRCFDWLLEWHYNPGYTDEDNQ